MITMSERIKLDKLIRKLRRADEDCYKILMGYCTRSPQSTGAARADALYNLSMFISSITSEEG